MVSENLELYPTQKAFIGLYPPGNPKEMILCILPLEIKGSVREVKTIAKVLSCKPIKNSEAYEARVQFEGIAHRDRELIIQYIFEDERRRRRHEAGL